MKQGYPKMLSKLIDELQNILQMHGDMSVAILDVDGNFYTSDMFLYPQEYYYDGGYIFPIAEEILVSYQDYETSEIRDSKGIKINPLLNGNKTVLKIIGRSPEEQSDKLNGKPYKD